MKLYNYSCIEGLEIDSRQANAVRIKKPDVIFFEAPSSINHPESTFNIYPPNKKPLSELKKLYRELTKISKKYPWVASDVLVYKNIASLWKEGHDVKLYSVDAPTDLLRVDSGIKNKLNPEPERKGTHLKWWVRIYLRERIMTQYMATLLKKHQNDSVGLVFLQSFHWRNVQFQLRNPTKEEVYRYYFGKFKNIQPDTVSQKVAEMGDKTLSAYWKKHSQF